MTTRKDTQWPRFEVFLQEKEGASHQDVGSVHAPDIEMALMNARDVFVRRPDCTSLWIVPVAAIFSRTQQELTAAKPLEEAQESEKQVSYYIFAKHKPAGNQVLIGQITAPSPELALQEAHQQMHELQDALVIWVCPAAEVYKSAATDADSLFSSSRDKPYRMATDFHTVTIMRQIREEGGNAFTAVQDDRSE
jgi:ring-1,2-phenylacetyl-CoA epoxidase subunit PaaB